MEDIEPRPPHIVDLHCIHCAKRWYYDKLAYNAYMRKLDERYKRTTKRRTL
jgi:hypothetical protein